MKLTNYAYDLSVPEIIHHAPLAFENAEPTLFAVVPKLLGKTKKTVLGMLVFEVSLVSAATGIAQFFIKTYHRSDEENPTILSVPVLRAKDSAIGLGYGIFVAQEAYRQLGSRKKYCWSNIVDHYNAIDALILELIQDSPKIYHLPLEIDSTGMQDDYRLNIQDLTCLASEEFVFGNDDAKHEYLIGVHNGKLTLSFTTFNNWRTNEWDDTIEAYRFELPNDLKPFNAETLKNAMQTSECYDSITYLWNEDFGTEPKIEDFLQKVADSLNPYISFLNGIKQLYSA